MAKILVTGGAGFIGSHVVDAYIAEGHEVTVVDNLSTGSKKNLHPKAKFVALDIADPALGSLFADLKFDVVNHHAAQIDVRHSAQNPLHDASINILGTLRLLGHARAHGVNKFIFASSGGVMYGECPSRPAKEDDPSKPESPYGLSKAAAEAYIRFYAKAHRLSCTILRYANVYGPRQDPHGEAGVIAIFINKLLSKEAATIYGTGAQERDYVHVSDIAEANRVAILKGDNQTFNIGTGIPTSVNALYSQLASIGHATPKPLYAPARPGELERSVLDARHSEKQMGWHPRRTLEEGLQETYRYFARQRGLAGC